MGAATKAKEIYNILNRWTGEVVFSAEIECRVDELPGVKLGLAVKVATKGSADLSSANLSRANGAELAIARTRILPEGSLIGWKKLKNGTIAKLRIPEDARRSHAFGRKCRAEFVDVIEGEGFSTHDGVTKYAPGLRVTCDKWDENWQEECAGGIHFFTQKSEAEDY